jgi:hypothetical protein
MLCGIWLMPCLLTLMAAAATATSAAAATRRYGAGPLKGLPPPPPHALWDPARCPPLMRPLTGRGSRPGRPLAQLALRMAASQHPSLNRQPHPAVTTSASSNVPVLDPLLPPEQQTAADTAVTASQRAATLEQPLPLCPTVNDALMYQPLHLTASSAWRPCRRRQATPLPVPPDNGRKPAPGRPGRPLSLVPSLRGRN